MGLDMYINRKVRRYHKDDGTYTLDLDGYKSDRFGCGNGEWIETEVAYWRKANAIHKWFVDNVQDGEDECQETEIDIDVIREIRDLCLSILKDMKGQVLRVPKKDVKSFKEFYGQKDGFKQRIVIDPDNLSALEGATDYHVVSDTSVCRLRLPTEDGFFFGSVKYNGVYFWNLAKTIEMMNRIIDEDAEMTAAGGSPTYSYVASW